MARTDDDTVRLDQYLNCRGDAFEIERPHIEIERPPIEI